MLHLRCTWNVFTHLYLTNFDLRKEDLCHSCHDLQTGDLRWTINLNQVDKKKPTKMPEVLIFCVILPNLSAFKINQLQHFYFQNFYSKWTKNSILWTMKCTIIVFACSADWFNSRMINRGKNNHFIFSMFLFGEPILFVKLTCKINAK